MLRAVAGSFLFGVPLLYTMEVWRIGNYTSPPRMLSALAITYVALLLLTYSAGFRKEQRSSLPDVFMDSTVGLAVAVVASALSLAVIGALSWEQGLDTMLGRVSMETVPFGVGAGISNFMVEGEKTEGSEEGEGSQREKSRGGSEAGSGMLRGTVANAGATLLGAVIIAFAIAPTEEVQLISARLSSAGLLALIAASLLLSYVIVFESSFESRKKRKNQQGIFQHPFTETVFSYLLSLIMALLMLWLFQLVELGDSVEKWIDYTLVLGLPATIGGAAGRLAV